MANEIDAVCGRKRRREKNRRRHVCVLVLLPAFSSSTPPRCAFATTLPFPVLLPLLPASSALQMDSKKQRLPLRPTVILATETTSPAAIFKRFLPLFREGSYRVCGCGGPISLSSSFCHAANCSFWPQGEGWEKEEKKEGKALSCHHHFYPSYHYMKGKREGNQPQVGFSLRESLKRFFSFLFSLPCRMGKCESTEWNDGCSDIRKGLLL